MKLFQSTLYCDITLLQGPALTDGETLNFKRL